MSVSNSKFLSVNPTPPLQNTGWTVKVLSYKDFRTPVAIMKTYLNMSFTTELDDVGAGSLTMDLNDTFWNQGIWEGASLSARDIPEGEYLFQCWEDGVHRFDWIGQKRPTDEADSDEKKTITFSGQGSAAVLKYAQVFPPNFPKYKTTVQWNNVKEPAMTLFYKLLKASQSRGVIPYFTMNFNTKKDSSGQAWADLKNPRLIDTVDYGQNLLDVLNQATGQNTSDPWNIRADWYMRPDFKLDVRQNFGARLENQVVFFEGMLIEKKRSRDSRDIRNYVGVRDAAGYVSLAHDPASENRWQRREFLDTTHAQLTDALRRNKVAQILLQMKKDELSEWTLQIPYNSPGRRPFRDFNVGDWIGVSQYTEGKPAVTLPFRVLAITIDVSADGAKVELTLESLYESNLKRLQRQLTKVINTPPLGGIKVPNGYKVPPNVAMPVIWDPSKGFYADPSFGLGGGNRVFIQDSDPAIDPNNGVQNGDFWYDISTDTP